MSDLQALLAGLSTPPQAVAPPLPVAPPPAPSKYGFLEGLLRSTFSAGTREFVGLDPGTQIERWREEHPVGSVASQILGFAAPSIPATVLGAPAIGAAARGLGAARAAAGIGARVAPSVASAAAPLVRGALEGAQLAAGAEAVRLGISVPFGDPEKVANQALYNIPLGGAFGAVFAGVPQYFRGLPSSQAKFLGMAVKQFPGKVDVNAPPNIILQQLLNIKNTSQNLSEEAELVLKQAIEGTVVKTAQGKVSSFPGLVNLILDQEAPIRGGARTPAYVAQLEPGFGDYRRLNPLFDPGDSKGKIVRKLHEFGSKVAFKADDVKHQLNADATYIKRDWLKGGGIGPQDYERKFKDISQAAGLPQDWVANAVYPRLIGFKSPEASKKFLNTISGTLTPTGSTVQRFYGTERNGLHVLATRLKMSADPKDDLWVMFKTDNLEKFEPALAGLKKNNPIFPDLPKRNAMDEVVTIDAARLVANKGQAGFAPEVQVRLGNTQLGGYMERLMKALPDDFEIQGLEENKIVDKMVERLLSGRAKEAAQDLVHSTRAAASALDYGAKKLVSPLITQFRGSPIFQRISVMSQAMFNEAQKQAEELWRGTSSLPVRKGAPITRPVQAVGRAFEPRPTSASALYSSFTPADNKQFAMLRLMGLNPNTIQNNVKANPKGLSWTRWARANNISPNVSQAIQKTIDINMKTLDEFNASAKALGISVIDILPEHFGIMNSWKGSLRGQVLGADGTMYVVDGNFRGEVLDKAADIIHLLKQQGIDATFDKSAIKASGGLVDDFKLAQTALKNENTGMYQTIRNGLFQGNGSLPPAPNRVKARFGVRGYAGDPYKPMSNQELEQLAFKSLLELKSLTAENLIKLQFGPEIARWQSAWPGLASQLDDRISKMAGRGTPSTFSKAFDEFFDPYFGHNSLDRLARAVNETMFTLTLGVGNLAFPAMNAVQFVQGALPEVALFKNAPPQVLQDLYEISMIPTKNGMFPAHTLSAPKVAARAIKRVFGTSKQDLDIMRKAAERGTIAPRWVDDFMGSTSRNANWKAFRSGKTSFPDWLRGMNAFLPAESEKFTRMVSYFMADDMARLAGMTDEVKIAQFADNFVRRTMYEYGPAARPNIFQGGLGKMAGLFKNWTFNYLANMRVYGSEAWQGALSGNLKRAEPMAWLLASSGLLGGAAAMPGFFVFDKAVKLASDQNFQDLLYENVGANPVSDVLYYGLPATAGITLQGNVEAPGADALRTVDMLTSFVLVDRLKSFATGIDAAGNMLEHGMHPSEDKRVWSNLVRALAPRTMARGFQALDGKMTSLTTGNAIIDDVNLVEAMAYAFGITPLEIQKNYDALEDAYSSKETRQRGLEAYGEAAAQDLERGDYKEFNQTLRNARLDGFNPFDVSKSAKERLRKSQEGLVNRDYKKDLETQKRLKRFGIDD